jgi:hypothetical protein
MPERGVPALCGRSRTRTQERTMWCAADSARVFARPDRRGDMVSASLLEEVPHHLQPEGSGMYAGKSRDLVMEIPRTA